MIIYTLRVHLELKILLIAHNFPKCYSLRLGTLWAILEIFGQWVRFLAVSALSRYELSDAKVYSSHGQWTSYRNDAKKMISLMEKCPTYFTAQCGKGHVVN